MNIAFRVDASLRIGTGHFARCLTLANALKHRGGNILFVCRHMTDFTRTQIQNSGHAVVALPQRNEAPDSDLAHAAWLSVSQATDAADTLAALCHKTFDWLVVDHYGLDARWETALRPAADRLLGLDDIADRSHDVDLFLDQNLQSTDEDRYAGLLPVHCRCLIGPRFALLRPEFKALAATLPAMREGVNIFFGGTDPDGMTVRAAEAFGRPLLRNVPVDIVIGVDNPHRARITALVDNIPGSELHVQPADLGALMRRARLALGAGGSTSWERCCLGLPTAIVSIADNQKNSCRALAEARAAIYLGDIAEVTADHIAEVLQKLLSKPRLLAAMARRAATLVDGRGTERVALAMMGGEICLRHAGIEDSEKAWTWRNDRGVRIQSFDTTPVERENHAIWWRAALTDSLRILLIAYCGPTDVGVLRFDLQADQATISIYLDPALTGLGMGRSILRAGKDWLIREQAASQEVVCVNKAV